MRFARHLLAAALMTLTVTAGAFAAGSSAAAG
jgi:hypothetical protein